MSQFLFEFEDKPWFPNFLRTYMTDYLQFIFSKFNLYSPVLEIIHETLTKTTLNKIIDLCSGSGGPLPALKRDYELKYNTSLFVRLTDIYIPNEILSRLPHGITYEQEPIDADNIPQDVHGLRTMFSSMHHFRTHKLENILYDAVKKNQPIAFFDSGNKNLLMIFYIVTFHLLGIFLFTPFIKPLSFKRLLFTYAIPLITFFTVWDGIISILRLHTIEDLHKIIDKEKFSSYNWSLGTVINNFGMKIVYIVGISKNLDVEKI